MLPSWQHHQVNEILYLFQLVLLLNYSNINHYLSVLQRSNARGPGPAMGGGDVAIDMGNADTSPLMNEMNQMQIMDEQVPTYKLPNTISKS